MDLQKSNREFGYDGINETVQFAGFRGYTKLSHPGVKLVDLY